MEQSNNESKKKEDTAMPLPALRPTDISTKPGQSCMHCQAFRIVGSYQGVPACDLAQRIALGEEGPCTPCRYFGGRTKQCVLSPVSDAQALWTQADATRKSSQSSGSHEALKDQTIDLIKDPKEWDLNSNDKMMPDVPASWTGERPRHQPRKFVDSIKKRPFKQPGGLPKFEKVFRKPEARRNNWISRPAETNSAPETIGESSSGSNNTSALGKRRRDDDDESAPRKRRVVRLTVDKSSDWKLFDTDGKVIASGTAPDDELAPQNRRFETFTVGKSSDWELLDTDGELIVASKLAGRRNDTNASTMPREPLVEPKPPTALDNTEATRVGLSNDAAVPPAVNSTTTVMNAQDKLLGLIPHDASLRLPVLGRPANEQNIKDIFEVWETWPDDEESFALAIKETYGVDWYELKAKQHGATQGIEPPHPGQKDSFDT